MVKLMKWILGKVLLYGLIFGFFYLIGDSLGLIPQNVKTFVGETVSFLKGNFVLLIFAFCFLATLWAIVKLATRGSKNKEKE